MLFGGTVWTLLVSLPPEEALIAPRWAIVGGGLLFWFLVGFLVGVFNTPRLADEIDSPAKTRNSFIQRILVAVGWFLYRFLVGYFVGTVATLVFSVVGFIPWFVVFHFVLGLDKGPSGRLVIDAVGSGMMAGIVCGISGGVFGALTGTRRSSFHRPAIGSRAVRSSFLSFLTGIPIGTAMGWLPTEESQEMQVFFSIAISVPIGILAGILGGLWTDVNSIRDGRND